MPKSIEQEIQKMIDRETVAWNTMDAGALVSIFHPDMVWPWPNNENAHDPVDWVCPMGRFNRDRWMAIWQKLFDTHLLIHNKRTTVKITITEERDGAFAVVDVDTLWRNRQTGLDFHWKGRSCKVYTKTGAEWKLISHTGLLNYSAEK
jgi:ketosteroid isomerase-like protein